MFFFFYPLSLLGRMNDDPEQSQQVDASPSMNRIQTPLLNRFFTAAASPAVSLKNFGKGSRSHHAQLLRLRTEGTFPAGSPSFYRREDLDTVGRIDEEMEDDETKLNNSPSPNSWKLDSTETQRKDLPLIRVMEALDDSISISDQPSG